MMAIDNKLSWHSLSDLAIIQELGKYLKKERMQKNLTQEQLAERAGLDRSTISQIENGRIATLSSFVQILRALEKLDILDVFQVKTQISPLKMLEMEQSQRMRVRSKSSDEKGKSSW